MKWAFVEFPTVIRSNQKDLQGQQHLQDLLEPILQQHFHKCEKTLGEEYCNLLQVDTRRGDLPSVLKRLAYCISSTIPSLLAASKHRRIRAIGRIAKVLLTIQLAFFYFGWIPAYHASKWILGLRYIIHPRQDPRARGRPDFLYVLLGIASLCMSASQILKLYREFRAEVKQDDEKECKSAKEDLCTLCLNQRQDSSCLPCGHVFCWTCLCKWLHHRQECPLCRKAAFHSDILHLQNMS